MPEPVLRVVRGTTIGLQTLGAGRSVRMGQRFEHSANLDVVGPAGRAMVVNLTRDVSSPCQVQLDDASHRLADAAWQPGRPARLDVSGAGKVCMQTPFTGPLDPRPAIAAVEPWLSRSWFCSADGQRFGMSALRRALAGEVDALLGLGAGLTPAGDDVLVAWIAWQLAVTGEVERFEHLEQASLAGTTGPSASMIACALAGETCQPVNTMLGALRSNDAALLQHAVARLAAHGSTSGCDALFGLHALWTMSGTVPDQARPAGHEVP